jgi:hypothetical protein
VSEENKALVRRFYEAGTGDLSVMDQIVTADFVDHHWLPGMEPCPESACVRVVQGCPWQRL